VELAAGVADRREIGYVGSDIGHGQAQQDIPFEVLLAKTTASAAAA
jgi:hypothetical protein